MLQHGAEANGERQPQLAQIVMEKKEIERCGGGLGSLLFCNRDVWKSRCRSAKTSCQVLRFNPFCRTAMQRSNVRSRSEDPCDVR